MSAATGEGASMRLVSGATLQPGYVVVAYNGNLEAVNVAAYVPGSNALSYLTTQLTNPNSATPVYAVAPCSQGLCDLGHYYWGSPDPAGGFDGTWIEFSDAKHASSRNLQKVAAFQQQFEIDTGAEKLHEKYGLTLERSTTLAKLAIQLKNNPKQTEKDYDDVFVQVTGSHFGQMKEAAQDLMNGNLGKASAMIDTAAQTNGVGVEQAWSILNDIRSGQ